MTIFDKIKDVWQEYREPVRIPTPTTQPAGTMGGTQIVQTPPSMRQPEQIHATTPTVLIHGKEPEKKTLVKVVRDPKTFAEVKQALGNIEQTLAEKIPSITEIKLKGAEFRAKQPEKADILYTTLERGAEVVKAPITFMDRIEAKPEMDSIHRAAPIASAPPELRQTLLEQQQKDFGAEVAKTYTETGKALGEYSVERYGMFEKAPLQTIGTEIVVPYAVGYGVGGAFKAGTFGTRLALKKGVSVAGAESLTGRGLSFTGKALEPTVAIVTTGQIGHELIKAETPKQRIEMVADIGVGFAGAAAGWRGVGRAIETYRVRSRTEVPIESIIEPEVLSGVESFPMTRRGETAPELISRFKEPEFKLPTDKDGTFVWHAAPETLGTSAAVLGKVVRGTDVPGLYTSPSLSPHFLRVTRAPKVSLYSKIFGSPEPLEPTALRISVKDVVRLPESVRYDVGKASEYLKTEAPKGEAALTPVLETVLRGRGKAEAEAVITPETMLGRIEQKFYVKVEGHKVPIDTYKALGKSERVGTIKRVETEPVKASELAKTESYKRYQESVLKPSYYKSVGISEVDFVDSSIRVSDSMKAVSAPPSRPTKPRDTSYIGSIYDSTPRVPSEPRRTINTIDSYVVPPSEPRRSIPEIPRYTPPESPRYTPIPTIPPIIKLPKKDKKAEKERRKAKLKGFEYYIENPISSPFGNSVGKVK